jgi:hypothetical protein
MELVGFNYKSVLGFFTAPYVVSQVSEPTTVASTSVVLGFSYPLLCMT